MTNETKILLMRLLAEKFNLEFEKKDCKQGHKYTLYRLGHRKREVIEKLIVPWED